jgi:type II secretory pathway predicted ATPase ExeA
MYLSHWGLSEAPFRAHHDPRLFYNSPTHEEALARLSFLVDERRRVGLLMGGRGAGKSLVLHVFAQQLRRGGQQVALVSLLGLNPSDLFCQLAGSLGLNTDGGEGLARLWQVLLDRISEFRCQELSTVLLLDDADRGRPETLLALARLAQHNLRPESRLTLVLAGRAERMGRVGRTLLELAELRIDLAPWDLADTEGFLHHALGRAGGTREIFDGPAIQRLHQLSDGTPGRVSHLANLALLAAAGQRLPEIRPETLDAVYEELGVIRV